uniref:Uncharacterized protein n=1 Tax=Macrostomum lignano TaxID=282301 RepID=A0A1I8FKQ7_9PLAT
MPTPSRTGNGASRDAKRPVDCLVAVEDVRVFNPGTLYMRHALPAYIRHSWSVCAPGPGQRPPVSYRGCVTFNRDPDGRDFGQLTARSSRCTAMRPCCAFCPRSNLCATPDPARSERVPVGHLGRLLSASSGSSCSGSAAERHLLLIVHSRLRGQHGPLTRAVRAWSMEGGSWRFGHFAASQVELVLVPECIPAVTGRCRRNRQLPPAQVQSQQSGAQAAPDSSAPQPVPSSAAAAPCRCPDVSEPSAFCGGAAGLAVPASRISARNQCQFVQLGPLVLPTGASAASTSRCRAPPAPCLKRRSPRPSSGCPQGIGKDRLLMALIFSGDLKRTSRPAERARRRPAGALACGAPYDGPARGRHCGPPSRPIRMSSCATCGLGFSGRGSRRAQPQAGRPVVRAQPPQQTALSAARHGVAMHSVSSAQLPHHQQPAVHRLQIVSQAGE